MGVEALANKPVSYYVDFENVHNEGLEGIEKLSEDAQVIIFYSKKANTILIDQAINVFSSKADVSFVKIDNGTPNALDFQLTTMLIASISNNREYVIVSADTGYEAVIKMARRMGLPSVSRRARIAGNEAGSVSQSSEHASPGENVSTNDQLAQTESSFNEAVRKGLEKGGSVSSEITPGEIHSGEPGAEAILNGDASANRVRVVQQTVDSGQLHNRDTISDTQVPQGKESATKKDATQQSKGMKKRDLVNQELEAAGVKLKQQQLSVVMNALNSTRKKQDFYIHIIRAEGQQKGLSLYRTIRSLYDKLSAIVC